MRFAIYFKKQITDLNILSKSNKNQNLFPFKKRQYKNETGDLSSNIGPRKPTRKLVMIIIIKQNRMRFFCNFAMT